MGYVAIVHCTVNIILFVDIPADTTKLPCEFCGNLFPMDALILHQVGIVKRKFLMIFCLEGTLH